MASAKVWFGNVFGRFVFREARVTSVRAVSSSFQSVTAAGEGLQSASWEPGDKVQLFLGDDGMRTYTPMRWDAARGETEFLAYVHGDAPGARWARTVKPGDELRVFGPRRSLSLAPEGSVVLFGDETSFAVARSLHETRGELTCVFEVNDTAESLEVVRALGLNAELVQRGEGHMAELHTKLAASLRAIPGAQLAMTGKAPSIQSLRASLRDAGFSRGGKVKAYWSVGKKGLD